MIGILQQFHFLRPAWLGLIPLAVGVWWLWRRNSDALRGWRAQIAPELLNALVIRDVGPSGWGQLGLLAAWVLAAVAIAGPTWRLEPNPFASDAPPLVVLLKAGESMLLAPPTPSRLERAQLKIADLAEARNGQPLGLIAYAGTAHLVLPPTRDTPVVAQMASEVAPAIMPKPGDRLDLAIRKATAVLGEQQEGGSLLVVADSAKLDARARDSLRGLKPSFPIQFLAIIPEGSPELEDLEQAARELRATVQPLSADDADIGSIISFAERRASAGMAGESSRWEEAGYWLTPAIALLVAFSFRRTHTTETMARQ